MTAPRILEPGQSYRGWKARRDAAVERRAHIGTAGHKAKRAAIADLKHADALRSAIPAAIEKRDNLVATLAAMRGKLLVLEEAALQHGRPHPAAMQLTFDIASTERIVVAAGAAVVEAQARYDAELARQADKAAAQTSEADEDEDLPEPVAAPKGRKARVLQ